MTKEIKECGPEGGQGKEYVVGPLNGDQVHWWVLRNGRYEVLPRGTDGILPWEVFPV